MDRNSTNNSNANPMSMSRMSRTLLRRLALFGLVFALTLDYFGVQAGVPLPAHAATNQFHGVNWADPNDNFVTGNLVPVGLSTSDSYATTYTKATAILKGFQSLGANTVRMPFNPATMSGSWWNSYTGGPGRGQRAGHERGASHPGCRTGQSSDTTSFYTMWDVVINKYGGNSHFYFDIMNEPWGYSASR